MIQYMQYIKLYIKQANKILSPIVLPLKILNS